MYLEASLSGKPCMGQSALGGCSNGSVDPAETEPIKPKGVEDCRKQFRYFPCCNLKDGNIELDITVEIIDITNLFQFSVM